MAKPPALHDWDQIRNDLLASLDGSRLARDRLRNILGADHGSDRVGWHEAARQLLRTQTEAALASLGCTQADVAEAVAQDEHAFYSLDPVAALRRTARGLANPKARAAAERYAKSLEPKPDVELESLIPEDRLWVGDSECVDQASDYVDVVTDLLALAKLRARTISCTEHKGQRKLTIAMGAKTFRAALRGDTDYIDEPPLLACLNEVVTAAKKTRRYYQVVDERWGQECGIAYASAPEAKRLRAADLLADDEDDEEEEVD